MMPASARTTHSAFLPPTRALQPCHGRRARFFVRSLSFARRTPPFLDRHRAQPVARSAPTRASAPSSSTLHNQPPHSRPTERHFAPPHPRLFASLCENPAFSLALHGRTHYFCMHSSPPIDFCPMILDEISRLRAYASLHPGFLRLTDYLEQHDLTQAPTGCIVIDGEQLFITSTKRR